MKPSVLTINGAILIFIGMVMVFIHTRAYGGNFVPQTTPEAIADLICAIFILTGFVMHSIGKSLK